MKIQNIGGATAIVEHDGKRMLLINHMSWNMSDAFIDYERVPNVYNQQAYVLLNHLRI